MVTFMSRILRSFLKVLNQCFGSRKTSRANSLSYNCDSFDFDDGPCGGMTSRKTPETVPFNLASKSCEGTRGIIKKRNSGFRSNAESSANQPPKKRVRVLRESYSSIHFTKHFRDAPSGLFDGLMNFLFDVLESLVFVLCPVGSVFLLKIINKNRVSILLTCCRFCAIPKGSLL